MLFFSNSNSFKTISEDVDGAISIWSSITISDFVEILSDSSISDFVDITIFFKSSLSLSDIISIIALSLMISISGSLYISLSSPLSDASSASISEFVAILSINILSSILDLLSWLISV